MMKEGSVLVVDDNRSILESCRQLLKHDFSEVVTISNPNLLPAKLEEKEFDAILLDMNFTASLNTGNEGFYWLREILSNDSAAVVIMITAYADIDLAVEAIRDGAFSFIQKPWEPAKLIGTIKAGIKLRVANREIGRLNRKQNSINRESGVKVSDIIGSSIALRNCFATIEKIAGTEANILLTGENGTGKELFAREIHRLSLRKSEIFATVDMGSVSPGLFESELFGHKKGAFTDAKDDRTGRVEVASGGSLFMDEIGNLPLILQPKILNVLQTRKLIPVGSNNEVDINIRLISATNMDLPQMVNSGLFREDLLYRINTITIPVPALRDRGNDIIILADSFLEKFSRHYNKTGLRITEKAYKQLMSHSWPGNIRELKHSVERAVILADSTLLKPEDFFNINTFQSAPSDPEKITLADMEHRLIKKALENHKMNISKAARELDITRSTLYSKMRKYDL